MSRGERRGLCRQVDAVVTTDLPDGLIFRIRVNPARQKYFSFPEIKFGVYHRHPAPQEGRFAIVTDVGGGMRWTQLLRKTGAAGSGRRSRVVLVSRR
jgi:hypothetical protein